MHSALAAPTVLVSSRAREAFRAILDMAGTVRWACLADDGTISIDGDGAADVGDIEIAWLSNDLFAQGLSRFGDTVVAAGSLRWLQSGAAGTDFELLRVLAARGVRISTAHVTAGPIAEYVMGQVLRCYQRPEDWEEQRRRGRWVHHDFQEVADTRWLVVGLGAIGSRVARLAQAFGAHVTGARRTPTGDEPVDRLITPQEMGDHVGTADVVVIAASGTPANESLVDRAFLAAMQPSAVLVNVARGSLVDEPALIAALDHGQLRHAVLDVARVEPPPPDSLLWTHPRITLTPHSSGGGQGRFRRSAELLVQNLSRYRENRPLLHEVDLTPVGDVDQPAPVWRERPPA